MENIGLEPQGIYDHIKKLTTWDHVWGLAKILIQLKQEGAIESFDFGTPFLRASWEPKDQPREIKNTVAVFLTSPESAKGKAIDRLFELKRETGLLR